MNFDEWCEANIDMIAEKLAGIRGGCSCHLNPPCGNCSNPITEDEAEELGWDGEEVPHETGGSEMTTCADVGCDCIDPNGRFWRTKAEEAERVVTKQGEEIARLRNCVEVAERVAELASVKVLYEIVQNELRLTKQQRDEAREQATALEGDGHITEAECDNCDRYGVAEKQREYKARLDMMVANIFRSDIYANNILALMHSPGERVISAAQQLAAIDAHCAAREEK